MEKFTQQKGGINKGKGQSFSGAAALAPVGSSSTSPLPKNVLTILVTAQDGREIFYKIYGETKMKKLMTHYCTRRGLQYETVRFLIDGKKVDPKKTANQLELEDGDSIDAMLEQLGGGQA
ncbi:small ubiquitin-related modifier 2-like [Diospyros lotus]|uniref:small ubiquitin-related modifier 2-like n=1 Tax=Diospyros lotus TaxID=55363 RepID=UPI0022587BDB|nr:small ubiquitin-related modifier 2-like [Diospyros lotus]